MGHSPLIGTAASETVWLLPRSGHRPARAEHAPFAICLGVGQDDQVRFPRTASQHPIARRSGTSAPQLCPVRHLSRWHQIASNPRISSLASPRWLCCLAGALLHRAGRHQSSHEISFHFTSPTQINPNWTSTCSMFKGATGQPVFNWQCGTFRCSAPSSTTALAPLAHQHGCR